MADFLAFKSATDARIRDRINSTFAPLSVSQAGQLAQDVLVVSRFYTFPLDSFLGIGAMENNYMSVRGDLGHQVWKRRAQRGDVVVKRRHGIVLVQNYSLGVWQITRETLRYAELLCLRDQRTRDYCRLPARLRPRFEQDPDDLQPETLTTYAGLLFRSLLDHFDGSVTQAVGAYNGGEENLNLAYAESVRTIAQYAHRVIANAARVETGGSI
jgi:Transglycosylase SLT domain